MPDGYHTATPYLMYRNAAGALAFATAVFGAVERIIHKDDDGVIRHAEFTIGDSAFMLAQENKAFPELRSVEAFGGSPVQVFLYLDDVDAVAARAVAATSRTRSVSCSTSSNTDEPLRKAGQHKPSVVDFSR
jgi:PhnB protein